MWRSLNVSKSKTENELEAVRRTVGFSGINSMVFERLREWMVVVTQQAVSDNTVTAATDRADVTKLIDLKETLARLYGRLHASPAALRGLSAEEGGSVGRLASRHACESQQLGVSLHESGRLHASPVALRRLFVEEGGSAWRQASRHA